MTIEVMGGGFTYLEGTCGRDISSVNATCQEIQTICLDDLIDEYKAPVTAIKIDVDGSCLDVLEGALKTIHKFSPVILSELGETKRLFEICKDIDYALYAFVRNEQSSILFNLMKITEPFLSQINGNCQLHEYVKMIFLVPRSKCNFFDQIIENTLE
jgi:hypothetical protein